MAGGLPYTAADEAAIRRHYPAGDVDALAAALGRSRQAVEQRARQLGLRRDRWWTPAEDDVLRADYREGTAAAVAGRLGRTVGAVHHRAWALRLVARPPIAARVVELVRAGLSDAEVAAELGRSHRSEVSKARRRQGLPPNRKASEAQRENGRRSMARLRALGLASIRQTNPTKYLERHAAFARRYGLPDDLHPVQVRAVVALARGPATATALAHAVGRRQPERGYHAFNAPKRPGRNYLTELRHRGLAAFWHTSKGKGNGAGRGEGLWFATATALAMMRSAPDRLLTEQARKPQR